MRYFSATILFDQSPFPGHLRTKKFDIIQKVDGDSITYHFSETKTYSQCIKYDVWGTIKRKGRSDTIINLYAPIAGKSFCVITINHELNLDKKETNHHIYTLAIMDSHTNKCSKYCRYGCECEYEKEWKKNNPSTLFF
jgi:hypothetical protein